MNIIIMSFFIKISIYSINLIINLIVFSMIVVILGFRFFCYFLGSFFDVFFGFREVIIKMSLLMLIALNETFLLKFDRFELIINFDMINFA